VPLPSDKIQIQTSGRTLKQMDLNGLIDSYKFRYDDGEIDTIEVQDMIYLATMDGMNIVKPTSRIDALKYPLSNIKASYHKRNVLLENIGAIGILSAQNSDMGGAIPMTPEEKRTIQKDWFNRSKDEIMITESTVNWQSMSFPTRDLMLFEELNADKMAIIDAYGMNVNLFSSEKGSTFSNVKDSIRMVYTDTIIPETQQMYDAICHQLGLEKEGIYIEACFDHLAVLQDDEQSKHASEKIEAETNSIMLNDVIKLNAAVLDGQMTRNTAVNSLVSIYDLDSLEASTLIN
jgi:phage portal protein BeeE